MAAASDVVALSKQEEAALKMVSECTNKFAIDLYQELIKGKTGNVFVSPFSVQMVLALAYSGARGTTASELATLLSLPDKLECTLNGYQSLIKTLQVCLMLEGDIHHFGKGLNETMRFAERKLGRITGRRVVQIGMRRVNSYISVCQEGSKLRLHYRPRAKKKISRFTYNQMWTGKCHLCQTTSRNPVLKVANRMFVESSASIKKDFLNNAEKYFSSTAESVDFRKAPEKSRERINTWVENSTNKKVKNLLTPGTISSDTILVLANAVYFKGKWKLKFKDYDTSERPFHTSKTTSVPVQMMHKVDTFGFTHCEELKAKILELEYAGMNFRMIIILPDDIEGLAEVESKLEKTNVFEKLNDLKQSTVSVALPKFKMEETMDLNDILKTMGASSMFNANTADFSGLSDAPLYVSNVVQKAFVEVNEQGTEAAAASGMVMKLCAVIQPPPELFIADHPFLFLINHSKSNTTIFFGRYLRPNE